MFQLLAFRKERTVPAAADRLDQRDGGEIAVLPYRQRRFLIVQQGCLRDDDRREGDGARPVLIEKNVEFLLRPFDRVVGDLLLACQYANRGELVFHLLERRQHRLPVDGDCRNSALARMAPLVSQSMRKPTSYAGTCQASGRPNVIEMLTRKSREPAPERARG
jgi:hypothetical protein